MGKLPPKVVTEQGTVFESIMKNLNFGSHVGLHQGTPKGLVNQLDCCQGHSAPSTPSAKVVK